MWENERTEGHLRLGSAGEGGLFHFISFFLLLLFLFLFSKSYSPLPPNRRILFLFFSFFFFFFSFSFFSFLLSLSFSMTFLSSQAGAWEKKVIPTFLMTDNVASGFIYFPVYSLYSHHGTQIRVVVCVGVLVWGR